MFLIFTKNGRTKQRQFQTCYLYQSSRDILSKSSVKYTEINQYSFKNCGPSTFLFGHVVKGCHRLHESHLLPLSLTYLQVLEQWNFLVSNFTLSFWILGPAFRLYRLFILKNIHMYMNSTHSVATVCSVVCGGSYHDALSCNSKSQYSPTSLQKGMVCFLLFSSLPKDL